ncbi:MAG TPA: hypothetical protein PKY96_12615 [Flavobacteriales bacterium]|nr:hypothetical protein [Flavobacteriales bacterium]
MKSNLLLTSLAALTLCTAANAQCPHDPVITPDEVIMCPNEEVELSTQEADAYQWLKDGMPIPGATQQTLLVNYTDDGGSQFSVIATVDGCSEASPDVLVDGWAFLLPYVIHEGDEPVSVGGKGESYYCPGAFIQLTLGSVTANLQWYQDGVPIPGANGQSFVVTEPGYYTASGAPGVCPDFIMYLGVEIPIFFLDEAPPVILEVGDQLCYYPTSANHQWYLNGEPFTAPACFTPTVSGEYTVAAAYACAPILSEPFDLILGIEDARLSQLSISPNPAADQARIRSGSPLNGPWRLLDATGRAVLHGRFNGCTDCAIVLNEVETGAYTLLTEKAVPLRIVVKR